MYTLYSIDRLCDKDTTHRGYVMSLDMGHTHWFLLDLDFNIRSCLNPFANDGTDYTKTNIDSIPTFKKPYQNIWSEKLVAFLEDYQEHWEDGEKWFNHKIIDSNGYEYHDESVKEIFLAMAKEFKT